MGHVTMAGCGGTCLLVLLPQPQVMSPIPRRSCSHGQAHLAPWQHPSLGTEEKAAARRSSRSHRHSLTPRAACPHTRPGGGPRGRLTTITAPPPLPLWVALFCSAKAGGSHHLPSEEHF